MGLALKYDPETGLQVSPVVLVMKTTLDMGPALKAGDEFQFAGSLYAVWPCSNGMVALFWGDIKMFLFGGQFEASINVFTTYFCGVEVGRCRLN